MKREIKFRAWDKKRKSMFVPDSFVFDANTVEIVSVWRKTTDGETIEGLDPRKGRLVLMQYVGLEDKNGRKIYDGDIVKNEYGKVMDIQYDPRSAAFGVGDYYFGTIGSGKTLEVIGNIFEDKQLLEENQ